YKQPKRYKRADGVARQAEYKFRRATRTRPRRRRIPPSKRAEPKRLTGFYADEVKALGHAQLGKNAWDKILDARRNAARNEQHVAKLEAVGDFRLQVVGVVATDAEVYGRQSGSHKQSAEHGAVAVANLT